MADFKDHQAYIDAAPEHFRPLLGHLRAVLSEQLREAEEIISYNMPGFAIGKDIIAGYAAFSKQCGLYVSNGAIASCADQISASKLKSTKTGVTFSDKKPIPDDLIKALARASLKDLGH